MKRKRSRARPHPLDRAAARIVFEAGVSAKAVAEWFGVSHSLVQSWATADGWTTPSKVVRLFLKKPWIAQVQIDWESGAFPGELKAKWGVSDTAVGSWAKRFEWDRRLRDERLPGRLPEARSPGHRTCPSCGEEKPWAQFYTNTSDQPSGRCKGCSCRRWRERRRRERASARAMTSDSPLHSSYAHKKARIGRRKARQHQWRQHQQRVRAALRKVDIQPGPGRKLLTPAERRAYWRAYQRHRRRTQPRRAAARRAVQRAVERGELQKPEACENCETKTPPVGLHGHHHRGYARRERLDVRWLCVSCHVEEEGGWGAALATPEGGIGSSWQFEPGLPEHPGICGQLVSENVGAVRGVRG